MRQLSCSTHKFTDLQGGGTGQLLRNFVRSEFWLDRITDNKELPVESR
jgi:hypothetical protein